MNRVALSQKNINLLDRTIGVSAQIQAAVLDLNNQFSRIYQD